MLKCCVVIKSGYDENACTIAPLAKAKKQIKSVPSPAHCLTFHSVIHKGQMYAV